MTWSTTIEAPLGFKHPLRMPPLGYNSSTETFQFAIKSLAKLTITIREPHWATKKEKAGEQEREITTQLIFHRDLLACYKIAS